MRSKRAKAASIFRQMRRLATRGSARCGSATAVVKVSGVAGIVEVRWKRVDTTPPMVSIPRKSGDGS